MKDKRLKQFKKCASKIKTQLEKITEDEVEADVGVIDRKVTVKLSQNDKPLVDIIQEKNRIIVIEYIAKGIKYPNGVYIILKDDPLQNPSLNKYIPLHKTGENDDWSRLWQT